MCLNPFTNIAKRTQNAPQICFNTQLEIENIFSYTLSGNNK